MSIAGNVITLALKSAGVLGVGQTASAEDANDCFTLLNEIIGQWQRQRVVQNIPGALSVFTNLASDVSFWTPLENVLVLALTVRIREVYGLAPDEEQTKLAIGAIEFLQANNRQFQPPQTAATVDNTGNGLVLLALRAAGRITDIVGASVASQDVTDGVLLLTEMLDEWQQDRTVNVIPGTFPVITDPTTTLTLAAGVKAAIVWNLAVRIRAAFGADDSQVQVAAAQRALAIVQANNKQFQPPPSAATVDNTGYGLVLLALRAAGRITDITGATTSSQDVTDGVMLLTEMLDEWQQDRTVHVIPGTFPVITNPASTLTLGAGVKSAIVWNLAVRIRAAFGQQNSEIQVADAARALALVQANNQQQIAPVHAGTPTTAIQIVFLALRAAGRLTDTQGIADASKDVDDAMSLLNAMLAQWSRQRWLVFDLSDVAIASTGALAYTIGPGGAFNCPRPDRLAAAFVRMNPGSTQPIDYPLEIIEAREDYNDVALKYLTSWPQYVFLDSAYPLGTLYFTPIPSAQFELHVSIKATLPVLANSAASLGLPPEYTEAMIYNLAVRIVLLDGRVPSPVLLGQAASSLNVIRGANAQVPRLSMPYGLPNGWLGSYGWGLGGASLAPTTLADLNALLLTLPTTLPATAGVLWNDGGVIALS